MPQTPFDIFVSSPGDVAPERAVTERVIRRLQGRYAGRGELRVILWEHEPLHAGESFQTQLPRPSQCDIVICILWSRLGTRLPPNIRRPDGSTYSSGTEYEFEDAVHGFEANGRPKLLVYRKQTAPTVRLDDLDGARAALEQKARLDEFCERWFRHPEGGLARAFHPFREIDEFEHIVESHLVRILDQHMDAASTEGEQGAVWSGRPYRGLKAFEYEHYPIYFGRTRAVGELLHLVSGRQAQGFFIVTGASGAGKSSLARAGIMPVLCEDRVLPDIHEWGAYVVDPASTDHGHATLSAAADHLHTLDIELGSAPLSSHLRALGAALESLSDGHHVILLLDQFEWLFHRQRCSDAERDSVLELLRRLAEKPGCCLLATMREDLFLQARSHPSFASLLDGGARFDTPPFRDFELSALIEQPATACGLTFESHPTKGPLADAMRGEVNARPGALALLSFTLEALEGGSLNDGRLTWSAYDALGGVNGALLTQAEGVLSSLNQAERDAAPRVFRELVAVSEDGVATSGPAVVTSRFSDVERHLIEAFVAARILVVSAASNGEPVVRIAHDALLEHWHTLSEWIHSHARALVTRRRLTTDERSWREHDKPDDRLIPSGAKLSEATELLESGLLVPDELQDYIGRSSALARRNDTLARRQAELSLTALLRLVEDVQVKLTDLPGALEIRRNLIDTAHRDLLQLQRVQSSISDARTQRVQAQMQVRMAEVLSQAGDAEAAWRSIEAAAQSLRSHVVTTPDDPELLAELFYALRRAGTLARLRGDTRTSFATFEEALETADKLSSVKPSDRGVERMRFACLERLASMHSERGEFERAKSLLASALGAVERNLELNPGSSEARRDQSIVHAALAQVHLRTEQYDVALEHCTEELSIVRELHAETPTSTFTQIDLSITLLNFSDIHRRLHQREEARTACAESLSLRRRLYEADTADVRFVHGLAVGLRRHARLDYEDGRYPQAQSLLEEALRLNQNLIDLDGANFPRWRQLYRTYADLIRNAEAQNADQTPWTTKALEALRELSERTQLSDAEASHYAVLSANTLE